MMVRKGIIYFCLLVSIAIAAGMSVLAAENTTLRALVSSSDFNGKVIEVSGEAIGEVIKGDKGFWINIRSEDINIGIFSHQAKEFSKIKYWGSYGRVGDTVKVRGIFYKNCFHHQVSDIHLIKLEVIDEGYKRELSVSSKKVRWAIILFAVFIFTAIVYFIKIKYGTKA